MPTKPSKHLETFDNPNPARDYTIEITMPEFTCLCPKTGQPDFATLYLDYIPDRKCVELKSLKLYVWSYRNEGAFHEAVTNQILADLVAATDPRYMRLRADFYVRGGIFTSVVAEHRKPGFRNPPSAPHTAPELTQRIDLAGHEPPAPIPAGAQRGSARDLGGSTSSRFRMLGRNRSNEDDSGQKIAEPAQPTPPPPTPKKKATEPPPIFVGIDLGTSSCRAVAIDSQGEVIGHAASPIPIPHKNDAQITQDPQIWWKATVATLGHLLKQVDPRRIAAMAVDGTSGTLLLTDAKGAPVTPAIMYSDSRATIEAERIREVADPHCGAHGASSTLAKLLWLHEKESINKASHALHQADWIVGLLTGKFGHSDYNNCLKLGYDIVDLQWPSWIAALGIKTSLLPKAHATGQDIGTISAEMAKKLGLRPETRVLAGTTDGVASFLAAGATKPGHAVTALGSTLVLKLLSDKPVFDPDHGVYSHRLGKHWLVGGASNSGGAVLLQYFKLEQIREMSNRINPEELTGLEYYPLPGIGERFPVNDPNMEPILEPLPGDSETFFQGILEGIAGIEAHGYQLLHQLGSPRVTEIRTTGGGAANAAWTRIRTRIVGVPILPARSDQAAYGTALLAAGIVARSAK